MRGRAHPAVPRHPRHRRAELLLDRDALSVSLAVTLPAALGGSGLDPQVADELAASTLDSAGTTIAQLRAQGSAGQLGDQTGAAVDALAAGFASATQWALVAAVAFLLLGLLSALRLQSLK